MTGGPRIANRKPKTGDAGPEADLLLSDVLDDMLADRSQAGALAEHDAFAEPEQDDRAAPPARSAADDVAFMPLAEPANRALAADQNDWPQADAADAPNRDEDGPADDAMEDGAAEGSDSADDDAASGSVARFILPSVAVLAIFGWLGAMLWMAAPRLRAGLDGIALAQFVAALCVPPALVGILWLLAMRTSRAEARRFASSARAMRAQAAALERTIAVVNS